MNEELEVLKEVTKRLHESGVAYMITGSIAMNYYAFPRMTRDIDIVIAMQKKDIPIIVNCFKNDFYVDRNSIEEAVNNYGMFNIIHNEYVIKVDFIVRKLSEYRQVEFNRRHQIKIDDVSMWMVSHEDLILSKLWWSKESLSEIQIADVRNLYCSTDNIDKAYIEKWVEKMNLGDIFKKVSNE